MSTAAVLSAAKAYPYSVEKIAYPSLTEHPDSVIVKAHAVAINPLDRKLQTLAFLPVQYPTVQGHDGAGEIVAVGSKVTQFAVGDRVLALAMGVFTGSQADGAFQEYFRAPASIVAKIPAGLSFEEAAVMPVGVSTAAAILYQPDFLDLPLASLESDSQKQTGTVLVWGAASSVGTNLVQLAKASGYSVVAVASAANAEYIKSLGADLVFDYRSESVTRDILAALPSLPRLVGAAETVGQGVQQCVDILQAANGGGVVGTTAHNAASFETDTVRVPAGLNAVTVGSNDIGPAVFHRFLPAALQNQDFKPSPRPEVVGKGLHSIQAAVDRVMEPRPTATKLVVSL